MEELNKSLTRSQAWTPSLQRIHSLNISDENKEILGDLVIKAYIFNDISFDLIDTRRRAIVDTNCVLATVIKDYFKLPIATIGKVLGKHHATILHYNKLYDEVLCMDRRSQKLYDKLSDYAKFRIYGANGYKEYDVSGKDNKELAKTCRELLVTNKMLNKQIERIKEALNV